MITDNPDEDATYTYEATFAAGSIGINLQTTRSGFGLYLFCHQRDINSHINVYVIGTYVDSFHRLSDGHLLPAELSGYIKLGFVCKYRFLYVMSV